MPFGWVLTSPHFTERRFTGTILQRPTGLVVRAFSGWRVILSESVNANRPIASNPSYSRVSRLRQALEVLHGTANALNLHSKAPQHIDGNHPPVGIEGNHVREHAAKREGFRGFA